MIVTNRKVLPPGLWVVATPIGNLDDMTQRATWALSHADTILCEDTRRTAHLFSALGLALDPARLLRFDAHSDERMIQKWVEALQSGRCLALVSDAGTPSVSDPGANLVKAALDVGIQVTPVPGVSAVSTLVSVAGMVGSSYFFGGFFPRKPSEQRELLERALKSSFSKISAWFESPHRVVDSLSAVARLEEEMKVPLRVVAAKELTKIHERIFSGSASEVSQKVIREIQVEGALGEWCFGIEFPGERDRDLVAVDGLSDENPPWKLALHCLVAEGVSPSRAAKSVSQGFGVPKNQAYEHALTLIPKK